MLTVQLACIDFYRYNWYLSISLLIFLHVRFNQMNERLEKTSFRRFLMLSLQIISTLPLGGKFMKAVMVSTRLWFKISELFGISNSFLLVHIFTTKALSHTCSSSFWVLLPN